MPINHYVFEFILACVSIGLLLCFFRGSPDILKDAAQKVSSSRTLLRNVGGVAHTWRLKVYIDHNEGSKGLHYILEFRTPTSVFKEWLPLAIAQADNHLQALLMIHRELKDQLDPNGRAQDCYVESSSHLALNRGLAVVGAASLVFVVLRQLFYIS
ncbi:hypothetical protein HNP46_000066 [Pseudomonas nitritireducens]|uniref:Uncharacterized protein n=1 Tax=Pseudomonas nitroreducens TaxID=46680 RepID=A0A7W7KEX5_PSENT|nr:hypothetical protein [Pseudomonas nitritireducens]MBB4861255.1 hypothetical protein [Pseudomonas nitritireducens]